MTHPSLIGFEAKVTMREPPKTPPVMDQVEPVELRRLRRASAALGDILDMAQNAFDRGDLNRAADVPMIALTAKIIERGRRFRERDTDDSSED